MEYDQIPLEGQIELLNQRIGALEQQYFQQDTDQKLAMESMKTKKGKEFDELRKMAATAGQAKTRLEEARTQLLEMRAQLEEQVSARESEMERSGTEMESDLTALESDVQTDASRSGNGNSASDRDEPDRGSLSVIPGDGNDS